MDNQRGTWSERAWSAITKDQWEERQAVGARACVLAPECFCVFVCERERETKPGVAAVTVP
jgi:hypothetical protein